MKKNTALIIVALLGAAGTICGSALGAILGNNHGEEIGKKTGEDNQNHYIQSQITNINGNNPTVEINSVSELVNEYNNLVSENDALKKQNYNYVNDLTDAKNEIETLESQLNNSPILNYRSLSLYVNGNDVPINSTNSMVTIDGRDYISKEIMEKLISNNQNVTIKDDTIFVGQVIADKASLFNQYVMNQYRIYIENSITDSYGNTYSNSLHCKSQGKGKDYIIYVLNNKYTLMKFTAAIRDNSDMHTTGIITIKADDEVVYTSGTLNKKTEPFTVTDIPIKNCKLLTIEYSHETSVDCIISDAIVYN